MENQASKLSVSAPSRKLEKEAKLCKTDEFSSVFALRRAISGPRVKIHFGPSPLPHARLGVVVAKRQAKRAVDRNRFKRMAREAFRHWAGRENAVDLIVRLTANAPGLDWHTLRDEMNQLLHKVETRCR